MKTFVKIITFTLVFCVLLSVVTYVLRDKENAEYLYTFRNEPKDSLDVLFIGSSHSFAHVSSMELWWEYGITSYNLGTSEQTIPQSHELLKYALKHQSPKLVVLEMYMYKYKEDIIGGASDARDHQVTDNLVPSLDWLQYIWNTVDEEERAEHIFPIIAYHERWKNLTERDFKEIADNNKGASLGYWVYTLKEGEITPVDRTSLTEIPEYTVQHIREMAELCKENGAELMLLATPYPHVGDRWGVFNSVFDIAEELDINYLYLLDAWEELGLDYTKDVKDSTHLNPAGQIKITKHIGAYIKENYEIPDRRLDSEYACWHDAYEAYKADAKEKIERGSLSASLKNYFLSVLNHEEVNEKAFDELRAALTSAQTLEEYLSIIEGQESVTFAVAAKDEFSEQLPKGAVSKLIDMGFTIDFSQRLFRYSLIGVWQNGAILYEAVSPEKLQHSFTDNLGRKIEISSAGYLTGNVASIIIDGVEYSTNRRGLNIVVWDTESGFLIDSVRFDTWGGSIVDR